MPPPLFTQPSPLPLVAPSILAADFAHMGDNCRAALAAGADLLHLDVMDGHFVPNLTMGPDMCRALRHACPEAFLDVHLMIDNPADYVHPFAKAGANNLTFHIEALNGQAVGDLIARIHDAGMSAGLAINPPTPLEALLPYVHQGGPDLLLVMSVNPGFGGQTFIPDALAKTKVLRALQSPVQHLEMDGGINLQTAQACKQAGCGVLVAGSSIFGHPQCDWANIIRSMRAHPAAT